MIHWSFERARFCLNSDNLLKPLMGDPTRAFGRPTIPEFFFDEACSEVRGTENPTADSFTHINSAGP
jgi:hypothetical protein